MAKDPLDRSEVNSLLRQLFSGVVIDYDEGGLRFQWQHGGETEIVFDWGAVFAEDKP